MRIRTIKPEFWQDEEISKLSTEAALLALGLLNFADDEGYFRWIPKLIETSVFPLRELSVSIHALLTELSNIGYITEFEGSNGKRFGLIKNFLKHQKVNRPSPSKIAPFIKDSSDSLNPHGMLTEDSLSEQGTGNREQGTGKGTGSNGKNAAAAAADPPQKMIEEIVASYPKQSHFRETREAIDAAVTRCAKHRGISKMEAATCILDGTKAIAEKMFEWPVGERQRFAPTPPNFFNGDRWADDPASFERRITTAENKTNERENERNKHQELSSFGV